MLYSKGARGDLSGIEQAHHNIQSFLTLPVNGRVFYFFLSHILILCLGIKTNAQNLYPNPWSPNNPMSGLTGGVDHIELNGDNASGMIYAPWHFSGTTHPFTNIGYKTTPLDPNGDGYVTMSGDTFGFVPFFAPNIGSTYMELDPDSFEVPFEPLYHAIGYEPVNDLSGGSGCSVIDIVDENGDLGNSYFWALIDSSSAYALGAARDSFFIAFRMRLADDQSGNYGVSFLIDADALYGEDANGNPSPDPNYVAPTGGSLGNPGFELEFVVDMPNKELLVRNIDGFYQTTDFTDLALTVSPTTGTDRVIKSYAYYTNCSSGNPIFLDFYVGLSELIEWSNTYSYTIESSKSPMRVVAATILTSNGSMLTSNSSDVAGTDDPATLLDALDSIVINQPPSPPGSDLTFRIASIDVETACYTDGGATVNLFSGNPPYTYYWSTGAVTSSVTGLAAGEYYFTATDDNDSRRFATVTIPGLASDLTVTLNSANSSCYDSDDGTASLNATNGQTPLTYDWSAGSGTMLTNLSPGIYILTLTDSYLCKNISSVTISEPTEIQPSISSLTSVTCYGYADGSIDLEVSGGTPGYTYSWSNGLTTQDIGGLVSGDYQISVFDINNCVVTETVNVPEPVMFSVSAAYYVNIPCNSDEDRSCKAYVTGGSGPFSYLWSNGVSTSEQLGMPDGSYSITVTDSRSCITTDSFTF